MRKAVQGLILACAMAGSAMAQHHHHPPQHAQLHHDFYQHWMRPDNRAFSCCNLKDCEPVQARRMNGRWEVLRPADMKWLPVLPTQIETERDSPDGRNHACFQPPSVGDLVYCFLAAAGG